MKVMPFLSVMKYGWHYSNAGIGMLRLLWSEDYRYLIRGNRLIYACGCMSTGIASIGFGRTKSGIRSTYGCGLHPGARPLNTLV